MINNEINNLAGFYRGKVLKHLKNGYCKIWIPDVYPAEWRDEKNYDMLPDAEQANLIFCASKNHNGVFSYPDIWSTVWCFFENGDPMYPVYFASTLAGSGAEAQYSKIKPIASEDSNQQLIKYNDASIQFNTESDGVKITVKRDLAEKNSKINISPDSSLLYSIIYDDPSILKTNSIEEGLLSDSEKERLLNENIDLNKINKEFSNMKNIPECTIELKKNGNIKIKSSADIELHGKDVKIFGENGISLASNVISLDSKTAINIDAPYIKVDMRKYPLNSFVVLTNDNETQTLAGF